MKETLSEREILRQIRRTRKGNPNLPTCQCGCGVQTKGGAFIPGHNARVKDQKVKSNERSTE